MKSTKEVKQKYLHHRRIIDQDWSFKNICFQNQCMLPLFEDIGRTHNIDVIITACILLCTLYFIIIIIIVVIIIIINVIIIILIIIVVIIIIMLLLFFCTDYLLYRKDFINKNAILFLIISNYKLMSEWMIFNNAVTITIVIITTIDIIIIHTGRAEKLQPSLDSKMKAVEWKYSDLATNECVSLKKLTLHERQRFSFFVRCLSPLLVGC